MMKNRIETGFIILTILLLIVFSAQAGSKYVSIQELRENTPAEWKETLIGGKKKLECTVDAPIVIPDVDRFPVLLVDCQGIIPILEDTGYSIEDTEMELTVYTMPDEETEYTGDSRISAFYEDTMTEEMIENADKKAKEILLKIWDMNGTELEKLGVILYRSEDGEYQETSVEYSPKYNGITYLKCPQSHVGVKGFTERPFNFVCAMWREGIPDETALFQIPVLTGEYLQDVPLLPFQDIRDIIHQHIQEGYVQSVCEIRLGYICCNNPDHRGKNYYLTPAWVVCGVMNSEPNIPFYPQNFIPSRRYISSQLTINAQTGEIIDLNSNRKETFDAHIFTWDDAR